MADSKWPPKPIAGPTRPAVPKPPATRRTIHKPLGRTVKVREQDG